jgi:hypothetical protein
MMAFLRHLFLDDFWWKLFSLVLAILIWFAVTFASEKEAPTDKRVFVNLPVTVVSSVEDVRHFKVSPPEVEVTVQGGAEMLQNLQPKDIRPTVDLTGVTTATDLREPVEVSVPAGVTFLGVVPDEVRVVFPPDR